MATVAQSEQLHAKLLPKVIKFLLCPSCYWCATGTGGWKPDSCPVCKKPDISSLPVAADRV